ncbi:hypothetical protein Hanom_Chr11g00978551 [Helianthus anomalus]
MVCDTNHMDIFFLILLTIVFFLQKVVCRLYFRYVIPNQCLFDFVIDYIGYDMCVEFTMMLRVLNCLVRIETWSHHWDKLALYSLQVVSIYFLLHWTRATGWFYMVAKSCKHQTFIRTFIGWIYDGKASDSSVFSSVNASM